jgi:hypothetical protein
VSEPDAIYHDNSELAQLVSAGAKQLVEQARSLGLTWSLRLATMSSSTRDSLTAKLDGDSVPLPVTNMTGNVLVAGQRVYVLIVPPAGNFVAGSPVPTTVMALRARATFSLAVGGFTTITWDTIDTNVGSWGTVPATAFTVPADGYYGMTADIVMADAGILNSLQGIAITTSAAGGWPAVAYINYWSLTGASENAATVSATAFAESGDTVSVAVRQNSAGSTACNAYLTLVRLA